MKSFIRSALYGVLVIALFAVLIVLLGCTEVTQTIQPSPVDVSVSSPASTAGETPTPASNGTITLEPSSIEVQVGKNVAVMVIVRDANGVEVPSENISVSIIDKMLVRLVEIDNRIITFGGLAAGKTSILISASGLQASLDAKVASE